MISLANLLTISRLIITPFLIYTILKDYYLISGILVIVAVLSDWLDGIIARKTNDVTKHGELLDPAVDKIFTISVLVAFVEKHLLSTFIVFLVVLREMIITWFRSVMVNRGIVIPASFYGKLKTTFQLMAIFLLSINITDIGIILLWLSIIIAYYSAFDYLKLFIKSKAWE
ncbi:MAG TPA: CDP-diacylglycerol--glycerol-3-phosphate 3-phosphatidyltransferase [Bacteroidetes bacterium]|nr:CDP-diacylglycerol--glycerol-3-phosphate 3-phosphatidyltransferase [Bacteroidota bacterium]